MVDPNGTWPTFKGPAIIVMMNFSQGFVHNPRLRFQHPSPLPPPLIWAKITAQAFNFKFSYIQWVLFSLPRLLLLLITQSMKRQC